MFKKPGEFNRPLVMLLVIKKIMTIAEKIHTRLLTQIKEEKNNWKNVLKLVVTVVRSLAATSLPLKKYYKKFGSRHNCRNFMLCLELISEYGPVLATHISKYGDLS